MKLTTLILLTAGANAIQLDQYSPIEDIIQAEEVQVQTKLAVESKIKEQERLASGSSCQKVGWRVASEDKSVQEDYLQKLDQTKRNIDQGILGIQLAQNKIESMKDSFSQLTENIKTESKIIRDDVEQGQKDHQMDLAGAQQKYNALNQRSQKIMSDMQTVQELEQKMAESDSENSNKQDEDLDAANKKIKSALSETNTFIQNKVAEKKSADELAKKENETGDGGPITEKERSQSQKDELSAFLGGN